MRATDAAARELPANPRVLTLTLTLALTLALTLSLGARAACCACAVPLLPSWAARPLQATVGG